MFRRGQPGCRPASEPGRKAPKRAAHRRQRFDSPDLKLTVPIRTRLTPSLFGAFCPLSLGGRQPACVSRAKNPAKIVRREVPCSFDGAVFRQGKEGTADNTCRIIKGPDADLAENCPSKPGSYRHRQLTHRPPAATQPGGDFSFRGLSRSGAGWSRKRGPRHRSPPHPASRP